MLIRSFVALLFLLMYSDVSDAYFSKTHGYLGKLLKMWYEQNDKDMLSHLSVDLGNNWEYASSWADTVKSRREYQWTKPLHYVDVVDEQTDCNLFNRTQSHEFFLQFCQERDCLYLALLDFIKTKENLTDAERMKFLLHFIQDTNQPMHLLSIGRGGNDWRINIITNEHVIHTNVHTLWDSILPEYFLHVLDHSDLLDFMKVKPVNLTQNNYNEYIRYTLTRVAGITCKLTRELQSIDSDSIIFSDYFKTNRDVMYILFMNYLEMATTIFLYSSSQ